MSKVAVVFWSGTGNTEAMANKVADAFNRRFLKVDRYSASKFSDE